MTVDWGRPPVIPSLADLTVEAEDISWTLTEVATAITLTVNHFLVLVNATSGAITITLPVSTSHTNRIYTIKKIDSSGNKVTIDANGSEKIDGEKTIDLTLQYQYVTIVCDGDQWFIIGGEYVKMEELLERKFNEQLALLEKIRREVAESKLHLASLSDENIKEKDGQ